MIDWYFVFTNSLWVFGGSVALAAFSYQNWLRKKLDRPLRQQLRECSFRLLANVGFLLVAVAFTVLESSYWWERLLWLALGCVFGRNCWTAGRTPCGLDDLPHSAPRVR